ncbi:DNA-binding proteins Bright/BRCAA1/rbp1 [Turnera subulata]|uniref:DNA-binding proteins Bright/BRCAA1/rbp1 n=1 Tax=Turnera subulata TaxID=218843 RepID=A0A9Q0FP80_9ROSI|nr:DNA-binding proteins Bright/BRCAA1/rbp1 [Turnera subulata]
MGDGYWNMQQPPHLPGGGAMLKRPRTDYEIPSSALPSSNHGHDMHSYYSREEDRDGYTALKDTKDIGSAYDRYLQSVQAPLYASGEAGGLSGVGPVRGSATGGMSSLPMVDSTVSGRPQATSRDLAPNGRDIGYSGKPAVDAMSRRELDTVPLPPDASSTLYIEGFPPDCTRREVARILSTPMQYDIFRPFVGYKEVRLVSKESKHRGGDPIILCFVDFSNPACAATALSALQGYRMDEQDPDSKYLRLQFSRYPGPRSGPSGRGRR